MPEPRDAFDVIVVGFGVAGATTAIEALGRGASVLVVDAAAPAHAGGNSLVSGQGMLVSVDPARTAAYLDHLGCDPRRTATWSEQSELIPTWLSSIGAEFLARSSAQPDFPELGGSDSFVKLVVTGPGRSNLTRYLQDVAVARGAEVRHRHRAVRLVVDHSGRVTGVVVSTPDARIAELRARAAVVLASGGYAASPHLLRDHGRRLETAGTPHARGDGLHLAATAGTSPVRSRGLSGPYYGYRPPGHLTTVTPRLLYDPGDPRWTLVDPTLRRVLPLPDARRHGIGAGPGATYVRQRLPPALLAFDAAVLSDGPLVAPLGDGHSPGWARMCEGLAWSTDNAHEIDHGWIAPVDTAAAGRAVRRALAATGPGPYYSLPLSETVLNTQGGVERTGSGAVLGGSGPVPALYAAGELSSIFGVLYQGSGNLSDCVISAWTAARAALGPRLSEVL